MAGRGLSPGGSLLCARHGRRRREGRRPWTGGPGSAIRRPRGAQAHHLRHAVQFDFHGQRWTILKRPGRRPGALQREKAAWSAPQAEEPPRRELCATSTFLASSPSRTSDFPAGSGRGSSGEDPDADIRDRVAGACLAPRLRLQARQAAAGGSVRKRVRRVMRQEDLQAARRRRPSSRYSSWERPRGVSSCPTCPAGRGRGLCTTLLCRRRPRRAVGDRRDRVRAAVAPRCTCPRPRLLRRVPAGGGYRNLGRRRRLLPTRPPRPRWRARPRAWARPAHERGSPALRPEPRRCASAAGRALHVAQGPSPG